MDKELKFFLKDLVTLLQEKYNQSLLEEVNESPADHAYRLGANFAYYDILDIIDSQISSFGHDKNGIGKIKPIPGQKI